MSYMQCELEDLVPDCHASDFTVEIAIRNLWHAFIRSITGLEVHVRSPVVGLVFGEGACCTVGDFGDIRTGD